VADYMVTNVTKSNHFKFKMVPIANDYMIRLYSYLVTSSMYNVYSNILRAFKYVPIDHINRGNRGNFGNRAFIRTHGADLKFLCIGNLAKQGGNLK
jgi:hypothetical protein